MSRLKIRILALLALVLTASPALAADLPPGVTLRRNIDYGTHVDQKLDIYLPEKAADAPILLMVHGGGWRRGDKAMGRMFENKVARWVPQGTIFVSINYRMIPDADPLTQAEDVAAAIVKVQELAPTLGGDAGKMILMGHSAGGHLVALINAAPEIATSRGAKLWQGTVALDAGALNVPAIMEKRHFPLYDDAFGDNPADWAAASPYHRLQGQTPPLMAVCRQGKSPCREAVEYQKKALGLGNSVENLPLAKSHAEINAELGEPGPYTDAVEAFMRKLGWPV